MNPTSSFYPLPALSPPVEPNGTASISIELAYNCFASLADAWPTRAKPLAYRRGTKRKISSNSWRKHNMEVTSSGTSEAPKLTYLGWSRSNRECSYRGSTILVSFSVADWASSIRCYLVGASPSCRSSAQHVRVAC